MTQKTIKRTRPYLCTVCGGNGMDPRPATQSGPQRCKTCNGTGILQIEELETWDDKADEGKVFGKEPSLRQIKGPLGRKTIAKPSSKW